MVGGKGRGRAVGGDGAMPMGCWLRGRSSWEEDGFKAKGEGLSAGGSERRPCVGSEGSEGMCEIRGTRGHQRASRGVGGSGEGHRGGGRCVDLAPRLPFLEVLIDLPCFQS